MKLYTQLASIYHRVYPHIFNYKAEFNFIHPILLENKCKKVLELGCGTGHLASLLLKTEYDYLGMDLYPEMINIAQQTVPNGKFILGDMRSFRMQDSFDAVIIMGKAFCHMLSFQDCLGCLQSIYQTLKPGGILIFDNFNASTIFTDFKTNTDNSVFDGDLSYKELSKHIIKFTTGWTWQWNITYYIMEKGSKQIVQDTMMIRAFTKDELELMLRMNHFIPLKSVIPTQEVTKLIFIAQKQD